MPSRTPAPAAAKPTLADRLGYLRQASPAVISAALAADRGVISLFQLMSKLNYRLEPQASKFCAYLFGRQLLPIIGELYVPQATEALGFLVDQPIIAAAKGAVISGIFPKIDKASAVAMSFVEKYKYSPIDMNGPGSADRVQLLTAAKGDCWENDQSISSHTHLKKEIVGAMQEAVTPEELTWALAQII